MLLDEAIWEAACPNRVPAASRALGRLIRFYISIEDGECSVERDLAQFREQKMQHRTGDMDFHDDALMVKLNGPSTLAQFSEGVADAQVEVTPFIRACASLWRETFGARHGHVNLKATAAARLARQQKPGAFAGAARGVLGAARQAVADARCGRGAGPSSFHSGAGTEASALWNDSMTKFPHRSRHNIPGATQTRLKPGSAFIRPGGVSLTASRACKAQPLARNTHIRKVATLGAASGAVTPCLNDCVVLHGPHRCFEADVVVVPDLAFLHDVDRLAANEDLAVSFLYIVAMGVAVVTRANLELARGAPNRLPPGHCLRRQPAAKDRKVVFCVHPRLSLARKALKRISRTQGSFFAVSKKNGPSLWRGKKTRPSPWRGSAKRCSRPRLLGIVCSQSGE